MNYSTITLTRYKDQLGFNWPGLLKNKKVIQICLSIAYVKKKKKILD